MNTFKNYMSGRCNKCLFMKQSHVMHCLWKYWPPPKLMFQYVLVTQPKDKSGFQKTNRVSKRQIGTKDKIGQIGTSQNTNRDNRVHLCS